MTLHEALYYGSLGIFAVLGSIVGIASLAGFWIFLRDEVWPGLRALGGRVRRRRSERRAWRKQRKSKLARALRDQVVARRER
jgi:hypothetical protein